MEKHVIRLPEGNPLLYYLLGDLLPSDLRFLQTQLEEPGAPEAMAGLVREYLEKSQSPPGSGQYNPVEVVERIRIVLLEMNQLGLWRKISAREFLGSLPEPVYPLLREEFAPYL